MRGQNFALFLGVASTIWSCADKRQAPEKRGKQQAPATSDATRPSPIPSVQPTPFPATDCDQQWALAVKQQPVGSTFTYSTTLQSPLLSQTAERVETITASSDASISRSVAINDPIINQFIGGLAKQTISIVKTSYIDICKKMGGKTPVITGVSGDINVADAVDDVLPINGVQLKVRRFNIKATNLTYAGISISADIITYVSSEYPGLPLKQSMTITNSSVQLMNGLVVLDQLNSALPTVH